MTTAHDEQNLLKTLLRQNHWQTHGTFCREWKRIARKVDPDLESAYPSAAQFYRWIGGKVKLRPYPAACKMLEAMFPGYAAEQLFRPATDVLAQDQGEADQNSQTLGPSSAQASETHVGLPAHAVVAVRKTFSQVQTAPGQPLPFVSQFIDSLEGRVLTALTGDAPASTSIFHSSPVLTLVGGFAGCGKTEFAKFLSSMTGWTLLDKDALTRPLTETLLISLGSDPNDRHTDLYRTAVRPLEYRCIMNVAFQNLDCNVSAVVAAPFVAEVSDSAWLQRLANRCASRSVHIAVVWVDCDPDSMYEYLHSRGAARDAWKLSSWENYLSTIDLNLRPQCEHFIVNNHLNTTTSLADQALAIANRISR